MVQTYTEFLDNIPTIQRGGVLLQAPLRVLQPCGPVKYAFLVVGALR